MALELGTEEWHRGEKEKGHGRMESIPGSWYVTNKGRKVGMSVLPLDGEETNECGREVGPTVGQRGRKAEVRSLD